MESDNSLESIMAEILYFLVMFLIKIYSAIRGFIIWIFQKPLINWLKEEFKKWGVTINGNKPHDIKMPNEKTLYKIMRGVSLGLGETYVDGLWECDKLDEMFDRLYSNKWLTKFPDMRFIQNLQLEKFYPQYKGKSLEVAEKHYDLGNKLFESYLGPSMLYSCAYWKNAKDLEQAQQHKLELIGKKLKLKPGMKVLDIGCGWGTLCKFLAQTYGVQVTGVTNSKEGAKYSREACKDLPVEILCMDYQNITGQFDAVVFVEFMEDIGRKNYRNLFELVHQCLPKHGILLCHTVGVDSNDFPPTDPWWSTYLFPSAILPCHRNITESIHDLFTIEDWHNFGVDYSTTFLAWKENFDRNWPTVRDEVPEPERFYRMYSYFFLLFAGLFRSRKTHLWQIVLTKQGMRGGYESVR